MRLNHLKATRIRSQNIRGLTSNIPSALHPHPLSPSTRLSIRLPLVIPTMQPVSVRTRGPPDEPDVGRTLVRICGRIEEIPACQHNQLCCRYRIVCRRNEWYCTHLNFKTRVTSIPQHLTRSPSPPCIASYPWDWPFDIHLINVRRCCWASLDSGDRVLDDRRIRRSEEMCQDGCAMVYREGCQREASEPFMVA